MAHKNNSRKKKLKFFPIVFDPQAKGKLWTNIATKPFQCFQFADKTKKEFLRELKRFLCGKFTQISCNNYLQFNLTNIVKIIQTHKFGFLFDITAFCILLM